MASSKSLVDRIREKAKKKRYITVDAWGEKIRVYQLSAAQRLKLMSGIFEGRNGSGDAEVGLAAAQRMFIMGAHDPDGKEKIFSDDEDENEIAAVAIEEFMDKLLSLNGLDSDSTEQAAKNSKSSRSG